MATENDESYVNKAEGYLRRSDEAFAIKDYTTTVLKARQALVEVHNNINSVTSDIFREALRLITEVLKVVWSDKDRPETEKDLRGILDHAIYALNTVEYMHDEETKSQLLTEGNELQMLIGNLDKIWKEELEVMKEFKIAYDKDGTKLETSKEAEFLHKLGNTILQRSTEKQSLLQGCALLKTALIRKGSNSYNILKDMRRLSKLLLESARAKSRLTDFHEISQRIYKDNVKKVRKKTEKSLQKIKQFHGTGVESGSYDYLEDIDNIKNIMTDIADGYSEIMHAVSSKCIEILGEPPCKFSHVAIGPLATKEITTYSKVETLILLDNDAKKQENFEQVLEYFRWYYLFFQVIVIYFGESPIDEFGIASLNDHSFHDCRKNWYKDNFTPRGLRCESMKEAGNAPIKTVKDTMKLISTPVKIADSRFMLKLATTYCIGGSEGIHRKFDKRVRKLLFSDSEESGRMKEVILYQMKESIYDFQVGNLVLENECSTKTINIDTIYHSLNMFLNGIGHFANFTSNCVFDIAETLLNDQLLSATDAESIKSAITFTYVVWLRVGASKNDKDSQHQNWIRPLANFIEMVGEENFVNLFQVISDLQNCIEEIIDSCGRLDSLKSYGKKTDDMEVKAKIFTHFGMFEKALECMKSHDQKNHVASNNASIHFLKGICQLKLERFDDANENFNVCLGIILSLPEVDQPKIIRFLHYRIGKHMLANRQLSEAKNHLYQAKAAIESRDESACTLGRLHMRIILALSEVHYLTEEYQLCLEYCEKYLINESSTNKNKIIFEMEQRYGECLYNLGHYRDCVSALQNALQLQDYDNKDESKQQHSSSTISILLKLRDCFTKLNQPSLAEKYCMEALEAINVSDNQEEYDIPHLKIILSQCRLKQNKYQQAAEGACEAFLVAFDTDHHGIDRMAIAQSVVKIMLRCLRPVLSSSMIDTDVDSYGDNQLRIAFECASKVYNKMCSQTILKNNELERDKSILIRAIQQGLYELNGYECVLDFGKISDSATTGLIGASILIHNLLDIILSHDAIMDHCEQDSECLCEMARFCNVRDSFSPFGAIIVFTGWVSALYEQSGNGENMVNLMDENLSSQPDEQIIIKLHCLIKVAKFLLDSLSDKGDFPKPASEQFPILGFVTDIFGIIVRQPCDSNSLLHETANLIIAAASCWMKLQGYEAALELLNEALAMQEKLASSTAGTMFMETTSVIENIGVCLAKLDRWDEAKNYISRNSKMKENRRKSRVYEDNSILHIRVKSAQCSLNLGNCLEAAVLASEAFNESLIMDGDEVRNESMISSANIVMKAALIVSVHDHVSSKAGNFSEEVIRNVNECATTLRTTLEDQADKLGSSFVEMIESLYYASGNCHYVLNEPKTALKCFKKALRILKRKGRFAGIEKSINLNMAKCLMTLRKYKKSESKLKIFLEPGKDKTAHAHPSLALILLAFCSLRRYKFRRCVEYAIDALRKVNSTDSVVLQKQIKRAAAKVLLEALLWAVNSSLLD
uniref:uncharacterized protein LOC120335497 n=1 Tax=Styela clava TaxID=7725 RepID=UPI0019393C9C|nr:uncharacterized protein LOC120335497 [Styela clava]